MLERIEENIIQLYSPEENEKQYYIVKPV